MAKFTLLSAHFLEMGPNRVPVRVEAGTVIDSESLPPHWKPTPQMRPMDAEAVELLKRELDQIRRKHGSEASVPAFGSLHYDLGGSLTDDPQHGHERRYRDLAEEI
jgi:hypothetical protein